MKTMLLLCALIVGSSSVWAEEIKYNFTSKQWTAIIDGTSTSADWTSGKDGAGFSNNGVQVTTSVTGANATSPISYNNISKIVVTYNTNKSKGAGTFEVKIGTNEAVSKDWAYSTGDGTSANYTLQYDYATPQSGSVKITANTTTNSIYVSSIAITYTPSSTPTCATPTFSPAAGTYTSAQNVTISTETDGATIYYTTNGDTPTSSSTVYDPANKPTITAGADVTVKAIAIKADVSSTVSSATYTYKNIANPVFGTTDGSTVLYGESVAITCATDGADIYYTQGSTPADPTSSSTKYTGPIVLTAGTTIKAIAINGSDESEVVSATYIVKATAPTFSLDEGTYNTTKSVMLSCTTDDATIYYTTDGTTPTNESTVYSSAIAVNVSTTINAIAITHKERCSYLSF